MIGTYYELQKKKAAPAKTVEAKELSVEAVEVKAEVEKKTPAKKPATNTAKKK